MNNNYMNHELNLISNVRSLYFCKKCGVKLLYRSISSNKYYIFNGSDSLDGSESLKKLTCEEIQIKKLLE